jgi:AcrR family transcriptional regulator
VIGVLGRFSNERLHGLGRRASRAAAIVTLCPVHDVSVPEASTSTLRAPQAERLSRALVISAATAIARRDGLEALSMRRLADELGVSTMAAYRHVAGKETLVDDVLEATVTSIPLEATSAAWDEQVSELALRSYRIFLSVPGLAESLHGRALSRPGIVRWLEAINAPLVTADIPFEARTGFLPAVVWMLRGAARLDAEWTETLRALDEAAAADAEAGPTVTGGRPDGVQVQAEDYLRSSLALLTSGVAARATALA